ncbi:HAMP domain-containing sensor histidine kinase [Sporofaciens musculi]|nr:HAMP domain-containing sensor histidine kinase [Sporofaciens musculi]
MIRGFNNLKIRTQAALVILFAIIIAFAFFELLWMNKWNICETAEGLNLFYTQINDKSFRDTLAKEALNYNIPESEDDTEGVKAIQPFFDLVSEYTGIYIYDLDDGMYIAGRYAPALEANGFLFFFNIGYQLTGGDGEFVQDFPLEFANGTAEIMIYDYERTLFIYPLLFVCLFLSISLFLCIILFFLNKKMRQVLALNNEILTMSAGDLTHMVPDFGGNEIGILARELNHLRESLSDNIQKEQESRKANQDLITALSHDLRTPLTILNGYLEVLKLKRNPQTQEEYLNRCLKKAEDIKELTDRMFEYALVAEENETPEITWLSSDFIGQCLTENCDFIRLAGFTPSLKLPDTTGVLKSDKTMLKRIFNNLFSNILKYGDKKHGVTVTSQLQDTDFIVSVTNLIKDEASQIDSNHIGLKNVDRIIRMLDGRMTVTQEKKRFEVELRFPLQ